MREYTGRCSQWYFYSCHKLANFAVLRIPSIVAFLYILNVADLNMINTEMIHTEIIDAEDLYKRLIDAELKIWRKIEGIAYAEGKHPDEVYVDLMVLFSEFIEKKYPTKKYPTEKSAKEQVKQTRSKKVKKTD